jgi:hypothetical protein
MTSRSKPAAPRKRKTARTMTAREELLKVLAQNPRFKVISGSGQCAVTVILGAEPLK